MSSISSLSSSTSSYWETLLGASREAAGREDDLASKLFADLDSDGSGSMSLEESGLDEKTYSAMDTDQDGNVTLAELASALELQRSAFLTQMAQGLPSLDGGKPDAQSLLASIMGLGSGTESGETEETPQSSEEGEALAWSLFSSDGEEEQGVGSASGGGGAQEVYDDMDTNQDGVVSAEEFAAAMEKRRESMGGEGGGVEGGGLNSKADNAYSAFSRSGTGRQGLSVVA